MLVLSQYHIFESYKTNIYRVGYRSTALHINKNSLMNSIKLTILLPKSTALYINMYSLHREKKY